MTDIVNYLPVIAVSLVLALILGVYFSPGARKARAERAAERRRAEEARQRADEALRSHAQDLFELFVSDTTKPLPNLTTDVQGVILKADESCCALSANAQHIVTRNKTRYVGGSQGVSIRIAKGVRYHVSGYRGHPITEQYEAVADSGSVYVTNKRFIFAGSKEVTTVPVSKIADVHLEGARVVVVVENRVNPLVVGITQPYWAPVIAAATHRAAQDAATAAKTR
jgi:hypothetical protein